MTIAATQTWRVATFDRVVEQFSKSLLSFTEDEALKSSHWDLGEDARLREDARFRPTPWGRWILASHLLANDLLYRQLREGDRSEIFLAEALEAFKKATERPSVVCSNDPRLVTAQGLVRLAAMELDDRPKLEQPIDQEKYVTHLPLHTLEAVAASEPAGEWGLGAQENLIETLGWLRVRLPGLRLNNRMFVARIRGSSMDNGRSGLVDKVYAVFELWPRGTKQEQIVLVRGAFQDPETGSYAIKKYMGDTRCADGRHKKITLVSLNPDKDRYPDIVLTSQLDDDLSVVARLVAPLDPNDYGHEPKQRKRAGRRDLTSVAGKDKIADRLTKSVQQFFEGGPGTSPDESTPPEEASWSARFVCLETDAGGLCIEAGPLVGLPSFAKKLQVESGSEFRTALASNFRTKCWRIEVPPSTESYSWTAPGFEEDLDESLAALALTGFPVDRATPFRIDASGVGQILSGTTLSPGQSYRILVPPAQDTVQLPDDGKSSSFGSWRLWELKVAAEPDQVFKELLQRLGLSLGKSTPELFWVGVPAACYRSTSSGETYPCFASSCPPILAIQGIVAESDGEAIIFLSDKETTQTLSLPAGDSWCVELSDLVQGNYMVEVLHESTSVEPGRLPFALAEFPHPRLDAKITGSIAGANYEIPGADSPRISCDFSLLEDESMLVIKGPPLWPVTITWCCGRPRRLALNALEKDGSLDTPFLSSLTEDLRSRCRLANLVLDFKELGKFVLQFEQTTDPEVLAKSIQSLVQERAQTAKNLAGQFPLLRSLFLDPFLHLLQYTIGEVEHDVLETASPGTTVLRLLETTRTPQGEVQEVPRRVLLLANSLLGLPSSTEGSLRSLAETLCWQCGVVEALVTDGLRWHLHKRGSKLRWQRWDLLDLSAEPESFDWEGFLTNCAVGV